MNMSEYFRYFFKNWKWKHYIHLILPFILPFFIGYPTPFFSWLNMIPTFFNDVNYFNGLIVSFVIMTIGLLVTWGDSGTTTENYTGKSFRSDKGEVFKEYETQYHSSTDDIWSWSQIHKIIFKTHFILLILCLIIKYFILN